MKIMYATIGCISLALGFLGIFLPLLPTTGFVLLSAYCFSKSSKRLHDWLLEKSMFGPMIKVWQQHRAMSARVKKRVIFLILLTFTITIYVMETMLARILLILTAGVLLFFICRIRAYTPKPTVESK